MTDKLALTGNGRYIVSVNGVDLPGEHNFEREAIQRATNIELIDPSDVVEYRNDLRVRVEVNVVAPAPTPDIVPSDDVSWRWDATSVAPFGIHAKPAAEWGANPRVTLVNVGGRPGVRLLTMPGDSNLFGSGSAERCDLRLGNADTDATEGKKHWWSNTIWLPDDYVDPPANAGGSWNWSALSNFHNSADEGGQANVQVHHWPQGGLHGQVSGGDPASPTVGLYRIGPAERNAWLEFVYEVFWTSTTAGYCNGWLNGKQFMAHKGPTLYTWQESYLKLANYHTAHGKQSAVIYGRCIRGKTAASVTSTPLQ